MKRGGACAVAKEPGNCVGCCLGASCLLSCFGTERVVLASLVLLAFGGRHLGAHMSQWHRARGGWGQGRVFSGRSSARRKGGNHIPERWKDYLPVGQRMPGTRFIAFKVPLKKSFEENLAPEERFSPLDLFDKIQEQNEELGLIIDLTYTHRYYKPEDLPETIPYLKIYTVGHQVPDDDTIFKFKCAVNGFLKENKDNDKLIGVHCTHGLNRTGYLICRYLIDVEDMRPDDAIELFNRCRGHCLERQNYIEDLQNGPIRKDWDSSVSRSGGCHYSTCVHTTKHIVNRRPRNNMHWAQGHPTPPRHFHSRTQDMLQSVRKCSQNQNVYQRSHNPPPGPPGEDHSQRRYSWNVKPNASRVVQNQRWYSGSYHGLSYPTYCGWTE
ncbi:RNA/RNP complex-1-interacting phosphatase [Pteropus vampyrus]|uniref:RNA/RNP complex-1-interacting phosphatase n=1 Tax=Pteropus vampyrus TaxID=132908 RepID=A0A6P3QD57_PTEVA|nr:RNA/RNP complex-1-interacting phosphatase [Pteropus vampyrus]